MGGQNRWRPALMEREGADANLELSQERTRGRWFSLGWQAQSQASMARPFSFVRTSESASIIKKMIPRPADAPRMVSACLGRMENRPYTSSMWTQYTSSEVCPNWTRGLNPHWPAPQRHHT